MNEPDVPYEVLLERITAAAAAIASFVATYADTPRELYELVRREEFPIPARRFGRRVVFAKVDVERYLAGVAEQATSDEDPKS